MCCEGVQDEGECRVADRKLEVRLGCRSSAASAQEGSSCVARGLVFALRTKCQFEKGDLLYSNLWSTPRALESSYGCSRSTQFFAIRLPTLPRRKTHPRYPPLAPHTLQTGPSKPPVICDGGCFVLWTIQDQYRSRCCTCKS